MNDEWLMKELSEIDLLRKSNEYNPEMLGVLELVAVFENARKDGFNYETFKQELLKNKKIII
jgi:hypothetical protein